MPRVSDLPARFQKYIDERPNGCWLWAGTLVGYYARVYVDGKTVAAHRHIWTLFNGNWPDGLVGDHTCNTKSCVNPLHIEPVTQSVNMKRAKQRVDNKCRNGHVVTETTKDNNCRTCYENSLRKFRTMKLDCELCGENVPYYRRFDHRKNVHGLVGIDYRGRIKSKVVVDDYDCWVWQGQLDKDGYGRSSFKSVTMSAHKRSYQVFVGEVPSGMVLDHLCKQRACVNPEHLEPVTIAENNRRKSAKSV